MAKVLSKQTIKQASIIIGVFTICSQLFGLVREAIIANYFGTSAEYDILLVALAIPLMVASILFAAIPSAGIPHLQGSRVTPVKSGNIFRSAFFSINTVLIFGVAVVVFFVLPLFRGLLTHGMDEQSAEAVVTFGRFFCLLIPLRSYEAVFRSLLHLKHHFLVPSATAVIFNVTIIVVLLALFGSLQSHAFVLAWVAGMLVQTLMVLVPAYLIYRRNSEPGPAGAFQSSAYMRYLGVIILIESIGLTIDPFDRYIGGIFLDPGYVSATAYANIIYFIPLRIFIYSLATAIFPSLSERAEEKDAAGIAGLYHRALALCVMLVVPTVVFFFLFKNEIIWLLFERGRFVIQSRLITEQILSWLLVGLFFNAAFLIQVKVIYALKSWRYFTVVRILTMALKVAIGFYFIKSNWALALGGGTAALFVVSFILMEVYLVFGKGLSYSAEDRRLMGKATLAALGAVAVFLLAYYATAQLAALHPLAPAVVVGIVGFGALVLLDQALNVSGINLRKHLPGRRA